MGWLSWPVKRNEPRAPFLTGGGRCGPQPAAVNRAARQRIRRPRARRRPAGRGSLRGGSPGNPGSTRGPGVPRRLSRKGSCLCPSRRWSGSSNEWCASSYRWSVALVSHSLAHLHPSHNPGRFRKFAKGLSGFERLGQLAPPSGSVGPLPKLPLCASATECHRTSTPRPQHRDVAPLLKRQRNDRRRNKQDCPDLHSPAVYSLAFTFRLSLSVSHLRVLEARRRQFVAGTTQRMNHG